MDTAPEDAAVLLVVLLDGDSDGILLIGRVDESVELEGSAAGLLVTLKVEFDNSVLRESVKGLAVSVITVVDSERVTVPIEDKVNGGSWLVDSMLLVS